MTFFVLEIIIARLRNCNCVCDFIHCSVRLIFRKFNLRNRILRCYRLTSLRHFIHIFIAQVTCFFVISDAFICSAACFVCYIKRAVLVYFYTNCIVFHTIFTADKCICYFFCVPLNKSICFISDSGYIFSFKCYTNTSCHVRLSELILRQIVAEFNSQIFDFKRY